MRLTNCNINKLHSNRISPRRNNNFENVNENIKKIMRFKKKISSFPTRKIVWKKTNYGAKRTII